MFQYQFQHCFTFKTNLFKTKNKEETQEKVITNNSFKNQSVLSFQLLIGLIYTRVW
jgi:hypothetical protein